MFIENGDGTVTVGPLDVIVILKIGAKFHACFAAEKPFPGPVKPAKEVVAVRLKSAMHHTTGTDTLEQAQAEVEEMLKKMKIDATNVFKSEAIEVDDPIFTVITANWLNSDDHKNPLIGTLGPVAV
jgi:hypothetical protein